MEQKKRKFNVIDLVVVLVLVAVIAFAALPDRTGRAVPHHVPVQRNARKRCGNDLVGRPCDG